MINFAYDLSSTSRITLHLLERTLEPLKILLKYYAIVENLNTIKLCLIILAISLEVNASKPSNS